MRLSPPPQAADLRAFARHRYARRALLCCLTRARDPSVALRAVPEGVLQLFASGPVEPGRALLVQLPGRGGAATRTFLGYVASADPCADAVVASSISSGGVSAIMRMSPRCHAFTVINLPPRPR